MISPQQIKRMSFYQTYISNAAKNDHIIELPYRPGAKMGMAINSQGKLFNTPIINLNDQTLFKRLDQGQQAFQTFITKNDQSQFGIFNLFGKLGRLVNVIDVSGALSSMCSQSQRALNLHILHSKQCFSTYLNTVYVQTEDQKKNKQQSKLKFSQEILQHFRTIYDDNKKNNGQIDFTSFYQLYGTHIIVQIRQCYSFYGKVKIKAKSNQSIRKLQSKVKAENQALSQIISTITQSIGSFETSVSNISKKQNTNISFQCNMRTFGVDAPIGVLGSVKDLLRAYVTYLYFVYKQQKNPFLKKKLQDLIQKIQEQSEKKQLLKQLQKQAQIQEMKSKMKENKQSVILQKHKMVNSTLNSLNINTSIKKLLNNQKINNEEEQISSSNIKIEQKQDTGQKANQINSNNINQDVQQLNNQNLRQNNSIKPYLMVCYPWSFFIDYIYRKQKNQQLQKQKNKDRQEKYAEKDDHLQNLCRVMDLSYKKGVNQQEIVQQCQRKIIQRSKQIKRSGSIKLKNEIQNKVYGFIKNQISLSNYQIAANLMLLAPSLDKFEQKVIDYFRGKRQFLRLTKLWKALRSINQDDENNNHTVGKDLAQDYLDEFRELGLFKKIIRSICQCCYSREEDIYQLKWYSKRQYTQKLRKQNQKQKQKKQKQIQKINKKKTFQQKNVRSNNNINQTKINLKDVTKNKNKYDNKNKNNSNQQLRIPLKMKKEN